VLTEEEKRKSLMLGSSLTK